MVAANELIANGGNVCVFRFEYARATIRFLPRHFDISDARAIGNRIRFSSTSFDDPGDLNVD